MRSSCAPCWPGRGVMRCLAARRLWLAAAVWGACCGTPACAQTASAVDESFAALVQQVAASDSLAPADYSRRFADWMAASDWRQLSPANELALVLGLERDSPRPGQAEAAFSVRWTGFLAAPADGAYRFSQLRNYVRRYGRRFYADGAMKVWLNGELVLDTTPAAPGQAFDITGDAARFEGRAVSLSAGKATPVRVEFSFDQANLPPVYEKSFDGVRVHNVQAVLMWATAGQPAAIIPASAYSPPADSPPPPPPPQGPGLKAEYFSDPAFATAALTRIDPGVTLMSTTAPLLGAHHAERAAVLAHVAGRLCDPGYLGGLTPPEIAGLWSHRAFSKLMDRLFAAQRIEFIEQLLGQPGLFANVDPYRVLWLFNGISRLPGDYRLRTLDAWGAASHAPLRWPGVHRHAELGPLLSWYGDVGNDNIAWIGRFLTGPYVADWKKLVTDHFENPDRSCRFVLAEVAAAAAVDTREAAWLREFLDARLADATLAGDARATWLIARAEVDEYFGGGPFFRPQFGAAWLNEAQLAATSDALRFQVQIMKADRLLATGKYAEARQLVDGSAAKFTGAAEQQIVALWRKDADDLEKLRPAWEAQQPALQQAAAQAAYVETLKQRRDRARDRGDTASVGRYDQMLGQAEEK